MKFFNHYLMTAALFLGFCQSAFSQMTPDNIWVTFEDESALPEIVEGRLRSSNEKVQSLINTFNITSIEQALPDSKKESLLKVYDVVCLCDIDDLIREIDNDDTVLSKPEEAPNYELLSDPDDYDVQFTDDYALDLIDAKGAWDYSTGDENTIIGISDGNFFIDHEDLENEFLSINTSPTSTYFYYHGTAVATTAAGTTNNGVGKSSIGYNCKMDLVSMNYSLVLQLSYGGARVINLSWSSGCTNSPYVQSVIDEVWENGTIIVAAAGNGGTCGGPSNLVYPAANDHVIAVSSVGPSDNHERTINDSTTTHQHNSSVDICAPGYDVALTVSPGYYLTGNGTSFAAPYVTGTIGLMLSANPCLTFEEVEEILKATAVDIYGLNPSYVDQLGAGRMDSKEAVRLALETSCGGQTGVIGQTPSLGADCESCSDTKINHSTPRVSDLESNRMGQENNIIEGSVYPNPTENSATVSWSSNENMMLYVTDLNGIVIHEQEVTAYMNQTKINIANRGVYFVRLVKGNQQAWLGKLVRM
ncbi:MAG: hypothetical protein ACJASQ_001290 [Crocinitomicaceae bacterium]|jgi:hypothetical protein